MTNPVRILALLSDLLITTQGHPVERLGLDKEIERVKQQLAPLDRAAELHLQIATVDNLLNTLRDHGPFDIIHFSGHGRQGELAFEDGRGATLTIAPMRLQANFTPLGQPPCRAAFLSACHSESVAQALLDAGVPHVVAIDGNQAVFDVAARAFAGHFYPALLAGKSVRQAFDFGRAAVLNDPETLTVCRIEAERNPDMAALANLLTGQELTAADFFNQLEVMKFKLLPETPADAETDPHLATPFPAVPPGQLTPIDLPLYPPTLGQPLASFTGRAEEMHALINYVLERPLTTVVGYGGMGKSELAREVGRWLARRGFFKGGITFIALGLSHTVEDARLAIAAALRLDPAVAETDHSLAVALPPHNLLILDELDHLCAEQRRPTRTLFETLRGHGQAHILATSRQDTGSQGEQRFELHRLHPTVAHRLFLLLAHEAVGAELQGSPQDLNRILEFLDGYPRAIVQAARQLKYGPNLALLLADLNESREELLQDPDLPPAELRGHESVLVTLNASFNRLRQRDPQAAEFFPLLAMFPAGISSQGLTAIFGPDARRHMRPIVDLSLVERTAVLDYSYLPAPVRSYARRLLLAAARTQYGPAALSHYAEVAAQLGQLLTTGQIELGMALTTLELPNLYYWLEWGFTGEQTGGQGNCQSARILSSLSNFYTMAPFRRAEATAHYQSALDTATRLHDNGGQANTLQSLGDLALRVDDLQQAAQRYQAALALFTQIDAKLGQANTLIGLGDLADRQNLPDDAMQRYQNGLELYERIGESYSIARVAILSIGPFLIRQEQVEAAFGLYARSIIQTAHIDFQIFGVFQNAIVNATKELAQSQPTQTAAGCATLLGQLQPALEQAQQNGQEEQAFLLSVTAAAAQGVGLAAMSAGQSGPEQAESLAGARQVAQQVDEATNSAFDLVTWLDEFELQRR